MCEYDEGIKSMDLTTCSEGYRWHIGRGGVDRLGSEWRTGGERQEGAVRGERVVSGMSRGDVEVTQ
jgi:hypothetical protein